MKRVIVIVAIVLAVGAIVGTFIVAGGDGSTEAKSSVTTTAPENAVKDGAQAIANAGNQVESLAPAANGNTTTSVKDNSGKGNGGKYETKTAFVGVSPAKVKQFKEVELDVRNFKPGELVTVTITLKTAPNSVVLSLIVPADEQGRIKGKIPAPAIGVYWVDAGGATSGAAPRTTLEVVPK